MPPMQPTGYIGSMGVETLAHHCLENDEASKPLSFLSTMAPVAPERIPRPPQEEHNLLFAWLTHHPSNL